MEENAFDTPMLTWQERLVNNKMLSAVKLVVGSRKTEIYAHKFLLANSSPVFDAMFYGDFVEKTSDLTLIPNFDVEEVMIFIHYAYSEKEPQAGLDVRVLLRCIAVCGQYLISSNFME